MRFPATYYATYSWVLQSLAVKCRVTLIDIVSCLLTKSYLDAESFTLILRKSSLSHFLIIQQFSNYVGIKTTFCQFLLNKTF